MSDVHVSDVCESRAATHTFLSRVLDGADLAAEYPLVFGPRFAGETIELSEGGEVRAACAVLVREFVLGARRVRIGLIGSVATDPAWRRRGLGTELLARAEEALAAHGCVCALLWADDADYYLKRGYAPFGVEHDFLLVAELAQALPAPSGVREYRPDDAPFLHRNHSGHTTRVERTLEETRALLAVPGMLTLVRERALAPGQPALPVAYACLGRGRDMPDAIHEWAGESEDVLALLRAHLERRFPAHEAGGLFLMTPPQASELGYRLVRLGAPLQRGILGLGKLLELAPAVRLLADVLGAGRVGAAGSVSATPNGVRIHGPRSTTELDREGLQALLFGGPDVCDEAHVLLARLGFARVSLPLEPFAFGLDSI